MSKRININGVEVALIVEEPDQPCQVCGTMAETRPYGPRGERVCYECGMKNPQSMRRQMNRVLFGEKNQ